MQESEHRFHDAVAKWIALFTVVCGGIYGFWQYKDVIEKDFRKPFWEKQLDHYFDASSAAATLATSCDQEALALANSEFYRLFYGPLAIVEDSRVEQAMVAFHQALSSAGATECGTPELKALSLQLAWSLRQSIGYTWHVELPVLERKRSEISR